jgi:bleomycin hydrolase
MEIIGIARDKTGKHYFICKNSWGTDNPYKGLMYMSENYFRLKTIAVYLAKE